MPDLTDRLARLNDSGRGHADDSAVAADLARGRNALRARRLRVGGGITIAALAITTVTSLAYAASGNDSRGTPHAAGPAPHGASGSHSVAHSAVGSTAPTAAHGPSATRPGTAAGADSIKLVAYHGKNLPGYTVNRIPDGYVLQGISAGTLDVALAGDHSSLYSFVGKIVVTVDDHPGPTTGGEHVTVNGRPGLITTDDGVAQLYYNDGKHDVDIQQWSNIHLTHAQLVQFAEGITVLPNVAISHG